MTHVVIDVRTATPHFPGIGRYVSHLARACKTSGEDIPISLLGIEEGGDIDPSFDGIESFPCGASPFSLNQQWLVPLILKKVKATVYHSPYYLMPYRPRVPTVLTCHDVIPLIFPEYFTLWQRLVYRAAHSLALNAASAIIAVSESTRTDLIRYFKIKPDKIKVIHSGVDAHFVKSSAPEIDSVRRQYGLPERYVLYVGTNKPHKNLLGLMEAWKIALREYDPIPFTLVVAGYWDSRYPEVTAKVRELELSKHVYFAGPVEDHDLAPLYTGASLFIFPSLYEGFGFPVLEAMACGTPVACSRTSSLVETAGEAASLFNPEDPSEMARHIGDLLSHKERLQELRGAGLHRVSHFTWKKTASETLKIYDKFAR